MRVTLVAIGSLTCVAAIAACNAVLGNEARSLDDDGAPADGSTGGDDARSSGRDADTKSDGGGTNDGSTTTDGGTDAALDGDAARTYVGCLEDAGCERVMFVTTATFQGNLGGLAGADAKCQAVADNSTLARVKGHQFRAWLSTSAQSAKDRLVHGTQKYVRANGVQTIANDWNDLVQNGPKVAIANEQDVVLTKGAWTGTSNAGDKLTSTCVDWTATNGNTGVTGNPDQPATWSQDPPAIDCGETAILICVER